MSDPRLHLGDCLEVMRDMEPNSIDSIVTDPPYGLEFMGKEWDHGIPGVSFWDSARRIAKPGAHMLAFGGTRTFHRLTCAIEDAGWEIRDCIMWVYGSGFPKSHNVGLAIDKKHGGPDRGHRIAVANRHHPDGTLEPNGELLPPYEGKTEEGKRWQGWGTALKPAWEPIIVARKPIECTVAENVEEYGVGALNIDASRVGTEDVLVHGGSLVTNSGDTRSGKALGMFQQGTPNTFTQNALGRWPANLIHDGSEEVAALFPQTKAGVAVRHNSGGNTFGGTTPKPPMDDMAYADSGSAARFFYCAKASKQDRDEGCEELPQLLPTRNSLTAGIERRNGKWDEASKSKSLRGNNHPTVKPTALMRYLCKLVTPPNGVIFDPFMGSGSTGKAAMLEGFNFVGCDNDPQYVEIARRRIKAAAAQMRLPEPA